MASSQSIVTETVVGFFKNVPPFQFLPEAELANFAATVSLEYFPKNAVIIHAGRKTSDALYVIKKGGVKLVLRSKAGKEFVLDMRSEGDFFGLLPSMGIDISRLEVTAVEDTICYSTPDEEVRELMSKHAEVSEYILRTSIARYMDRSLEELRTQTHLMGGGERLLYSLTIRDAVKTPATFCRPENTIREVAQMMSGAEGTCVFVLDDESRAAGIVTDRDFRKRVVAQGLAADAPITQIMTSPVVSLENSEHVFHALLAMLSRDVHHVLVTEGGIPQGVITNHDLMVLQGKSPLSLVRHLAEQKTIDGLASLQKRIVHLFPLLMREGAKASHITRVVSEMNDRVICRLLQIAEEQLGPPPVPYCWVTMGSEGRREQTFKTDQDNGLIYADAVGPESETAEAYFSQLAVFMRDALEKCGYPRCTGDYMASNPQWRKPLNVWRSYFREWITEARLQLIQDALICFDMRPVAGDFSLFGALEQDNVELLETATFFKSILAFVSVQTRPHLGFFRSFVVERTGSHKSELDLKLPGSGAIVNAARLLALDAGVKAQNTIDRLAALERLDSENCSLLAELREAFEFLMLLRLECQLRQAEARQALSNYVEPGKLTHLQRSMLKEAFQTIGRVQTLITSKYRSAVWSQLS